MSRLDEIIEPGERIIARHWPGWLVAGLLGTIVVSDIMVFGLLLFLATDGDPEFREVLLIIGVAFAFIAVVTLGLMFHVLRRAIVTDRRVLVRKGFSWSSPQQMRRDIIEDVYQQGQRLVVSGGGHTLEIPCPPAFAPYILRALARQPQAAPAE
jgi:hypothetical protein